MVLYSDLDLKRQIIWGKPEYIKLRDFWSTKNDHVLIIFLSIIKILFSLKLNTEETPKDRQVILSSIHWKCNSNKQFLIENVQFYQQIGLRL